MATPNVHAKKKFIIPDDSYGFLSWTIPGVGATIFSILTCFIVLDPLSPLIGIALWGAIYFYWGFEIVQNTEYLVLERFGEFSRIVHSGPRILCLPGLVDKIASKGNLRYREISLFEDEPNHLVDFKDGSSRVSMKGSYRVGPQPDTFDTPEDFEKLDLAIYRFTYTMKSDEEREERVEEILESSANEHLQALEIGGALLEKDSIAEKVTASTQVRSALEAMGIELNPQKGLIIPDIELSAEIIAQRQKKLEGASEADKQSAQGLGYARSIQAIMTALSVDQQEARSIYETQRGLEVLGSLDANVSFVAGNMKDIQRTMGVGDANPRNHQPKQRRST